MVLVLLLMLFLGLVSVGIWSYSRTLLTSAAADSARYVANSDVAAGDAGGKVADLLRGSIASSTANSLRCSVSSDGLLVEVDCTMRAPGIIGLLDGVMPDLHVTGHTIKEPVR